MSGPAAVRGVGHRVLDDLDEDLLHRLAFAGVAQQQRNVVVEVEGLADGVHGMAGGAVEAVDGDEEGDGAPLEVVHGGEAVLEAAGVGQHDRAERALGQLVPHEPEPLLPGRAEQVQHQVLAQRDTAEVHGHRGGVLALHAADVVDRPSGLGQQLLGAQRPDLTDRADEGRLAHAEAAGHQDLERDGLDRGLAALRTAEDHRSLLLLDGGRATAGRILRRRGSRRPVRRRGRRPRSRFRRVR